MWLKSNIQAFTFLNGTMGVPFNKILFVFYFCISIIKNMILIRQSFFFFCKTTLWEVLYISIKLYIKNWLPFLWCYQPLMFIEYYLLLHYFICSGRGDRIVNAVPLTLSWPRVESSFVFCLFYLKYFRYLLLTYIFDWLRFHISYFPCELPVISPFIMYSPSFPQGHTLTQRV